MKRKFIVVCILCIILIFTGAGCGKEKYGNSKPTYSDVVLETSSTDLEKISNKIMKKYLDEYKEDTVIKKSKITDYTINKIEVIEGDTDKFRFSVEFSLKPLEINSTYWAAGNGEINGYWIKNKFLFIDVEKTDNEYKIIDMGTGL